MKLSKSILLGSHRPQDRWEALRRALATLGNEVEVASQASMPQIGWINYDLVVLEVGFIRDLRATIAVIRRENPDARIIVFSASPDWKEAREAMLAGAVEYARKSLDYETVLTTLKKRLDKQFHDVPGKYRAEVFDEKCSVVGR